MSETRLEKLENLIDKNPGDAFVRYGLALEYRSLGLEESARDTFEYLLEEHPEYVPTYLQFAELLIELDELDQACEVLSRGVEVAHAQGDQKAASEMNEALAGLAD